MSNSYAAGDKINVNTASMTDLDRLPGVGPATAKSIIAYRSQNGAFRTINDLQKVRGIGPKTVEKIGPYAHVGDGSVERSKAIEYKQSSININTAKAKALKQLPSIGKVTAARIVAYREMHGPFLRIDDLARVKGIGPKTVANFRNQISLELDINKANQGDLSAFGFSNAQQITQYRKNKGSFRNPEALFKVPGADEDFLNRVKPLLR